MRWLLYRFGAAVLAALLGMIAMSCGKGDDAPSVKTDGRPATTQVSRAVPPPSDPAELFRCGLVNRYPEYVANALKMNPEVAKAKFKGFPPLAWACDWGNLEVIKSLVENGASVSDVARWEGARYSIGWIAVGSDQVPVVKYLFSKGLDPTAREHDGETLLWAARSVEMAELLVSKGIDPAARSKFGDAALHTACRQTRKELVRYLLKRGMDVELRGRWNMTPLLYAVTTLHGDAKSVAIMLIEEFKANVNAKGFKGRTGLHDCAYANNLEMAHVLIKYGALPNLKDDEGYTPLDLAILCGEDERRLIINLLIHNGAEGKIRNDRNRLK